MKRIHKVLCLLLSFIIVLSTFSVFVFAEVIGASAIADTEEYLDRIMNAKKTASDGTIYHERFDAFLDVEKILKLDNSERGSMESQIVAVDEYANGDQGYILLHYFNADDLPLGGVYDPDDVMQGVVGTCYVNGDFCVIREDTQYTSSIFRTFNISYAYGDYGYTVPQGNERVYDITDITLGYLPSVQSDYDDIAFSGKTSVENKRLIFTNYGSQKTVARFKDRVSNITEDFASDSTFDWSKYPESDTDKRLYVIQLAETSDNEVFVYVYHPFRVGTRKLYASNIVISVTGDSKTPDFKQYSLTLVEEENTICKYRVEGLKPSSDKVRYYDISAIHRPLDSTFDKLYLPWQTSVAYDVSASWRVEEVDGQLQYSSNVLEVVEITQKYVGYVTYPSGIVGEGMSCYTDRHFVVFNTDVKIDDLMAVKLGYRVKEKSLFHNMFTGEDVVKTHNTEEYEKWYYSGEKSGSDYKELFGFIAFGKDREWDVIQTADEFYEEFDKDDIHMSNKCEEAIENGAWVVNFLETDRDITTSAPITEYYSDVTKVIILQLYYETEGKIYNVGCVDNYMSVPDTPSIVLPLETPTIDLSGVPGGDLLGDIKDWWDDTLGVLKVIGIVVLAVVAIIVIRLLFGNKNGGSPVNIRIDGASGSSSQNKINSSKKSDSTKGT